MRLKNIIRILMRPRTIKIVSFACIIGFFFILPAFAAANTSQDQFSLVQIKDLLQKALSLFSRIRIILAVLAGKLMTNDFVYGAFIHMDVYLRKIRNIMKNFANFALAGLVLVSIIQGITGKQALNLKKIITNTLVAGILIQASWFLTGALIDISTVATAGISAFPITFFKNDTPLQKNIATGMSGFVSNRIVIDPDTTGRNNVITIIPGTGVSDISREKILPTKDSVSGPFIYMGMAIFGFPKYLTPGATPPITDITLGFLLQFFFLSLFTIGLLLLLVANIIRIGLLRIFVVGMPFLILFQVFKKKAGDGGLGKLFSLSNLLAIVFKPVIFVVGISLMLIVIVSMQQSVFNSGASRENNLNGISLSKSGDTTSVLSVPGITDISVSQEDILGKDVIGKDAEGKAMNFFSMLIVYLLCIYLIRFFIKLSLTIGGGTLGTFMEARIKQIEEMGRALPIVPFKGGTASINSLQSFTRQTRDNTLKELGVNKSGEFTKSEAAFQKQVSDRMHIPSDRTQEEYDTLDQAAEKGSTDFMSQSIALGQKNVSGLSLNSQWKGSLETWIKKTNGQPLRDVGKNPNAGRDKDFETTFNTGANSSLNRKALHLLMGGDDGIQGPKGTKLGPTNAISYDALMNNVYRQKKEK